MTTKPVIAATDIAEAAGLSEKFIGLTVVAVGTSLPEPAASVSAALKNQKDLAVGNVIGSNIFNLLFILPVSALVSPLAYNPAFNVDFLIVGGATFFLFLAMFTFRKGVLDRCEAGMLLAGYFIYTVLQSV